MTATAKTEQKSNSSAKTENIASMAKEKASVAKDKLDESVAHARDTVEDFAENARGELQHISKQTNTFVKENPGLAIAGAVGFGVLLGLALRQRS